MRGLFTKIFLCFWIAQSLTFVISTIFILQHQFRPDSAVDAFNATFAAEATTAAGIFEQSGCSALAAYAEEVHQTLYLADSSRQIECSPEKTPEYTGFLSNPGPSREVQSKDNGQTYLWSKNVVSPKGQKYVFLLVRPNLPHHGSWVHDLWRFSFPQLPVGIVVFGVSTFVLVLMLTRPIGRLRAAAGDLARGQLNVRVSQADNPLFGGDEIQGLIHDFNHMAARLESLMGAQKLLLRDVSHELRTPLTRLYVTLELAREDAPASMTSHLARIESEAVCLTQLIEQLLRLSSMESANEIVRTERFSFDTLLKTIVPNADFEARQRACNVRLIESCECTVEGLPMLLHHAVENVVRNAIRYTREGSTVELNVRCETRSGRRMMVLDVKDEGPGIPESEMENVFLPFYRVDGARQRNTGGFGVGLAIAERAVRLHHGEIVARNRATGGLVVTITVPCRGGDAGGGDGYDIARQHAL